MRIKQISLHHFGAFREFSQTVPEGLSLWVGDNESGKSTLMDALQLIFYGTSKGGNDPRENIRKRYIALRKRDAAGVVIFEDGHRTYRLEREFGTSNGQDRVQLSDELTGEKIALEAKETPGDRFFGLNADAFKRSVFVGPSGSTFHATSGKDGDQLYDRLSNLGTSGEEGVSASAVEQKLRDAEHFYLKGNGRGGALRDAEAEIAALEQQHRRALAREEAVRETLQELAREEESLEREKQAFAEKTAADEGAVDPEVFAEKRRDLQEERLAFEKAKTALDVEAAHARTRREELSRWRAELEKGSDTEVSTKSFRFDILALLCVIGGLLIAWFGRAENAFRVTGLVAVVIGIVIGIVAWRTLKRDKSERIRREAEDAQRRARLEAIAREEAQLSEGMFGERLDALKARESALKAGEEDLERRERAWVTRRREADEAIRAAERRLRTREQELLVRRTRLSATHEGERLADEIVVEIREKDERRAEMQAEVDAIVLAEEALAEAQQMAQRNFSPRLSERASEIFASLTGVEARTLRIDSQFNVTMENATHALQDWMTLSTGTIEQAYLALRIAVSELTAEGRALPLLMDDPFVFYDDTRARLGVDFLQHYSEASGRQILLFTSHRRLLESVDDADVIHVRAD
ncbi:MAG: AAA family ATPase [Peptoniphilaceae bacterium]|nr:AAA family ATPase [Peptoniphilaceae bacterium]